MQRILASVASILALSGCTTSLDTHPVSLQQPRIDGVTYALPALQLETMVTHRLTKCKIVLPGEPGYDARLGVNSANLIAEFKTTIENKPTYPASEYFVFNYAALASALKTSSFRVTYHDNRMLKTLNASAQDQSIAVAVEAVKAGVSIAGLVTGVPLPLGDAGAPEPPPFSCPTATVVADKPGANGKPIYERGSLIDLRAKMTGLQKAAVEKLAGINKKIAALNARAAGATLSDTDKREITTLTEEGSDIADKIVEFDKQIAAFDKTLAYSEMFRWQPARGKTVELTREMPFSENDPDDAARGKARKLWVAALFNEDKNDGFDGAFGPLVPDPCGPKEEACDLKAAGRRIAKELSLAFLLRPDHVVLSVDDAKAVADRLDLSNRIRKEPRKRDHIRGVVARQPAPGQFLVCRGFQLPCTAKSASKLLDERVSVPQLGAYIVLPYSNGFGEDNALTAEFAQSGEPTLVEYKENKAVALEAVKGLGTSVNTVGGFVQALDAAKEAAATKAAGAPLAEIKDRIALQEQQIKLAQQEAILNPQPDAYKDEADRLTKELELLKLQAQIAEQRKLVEGGT